MFEQEDEWVSKTQMKKQMNDLQALGMELTKLSSDTLKKLAWTKSCSSDCHL